jgi:hypothetical protein
LLLLVLLLYGRVVTTIAVSIVGPLQAILFLLLIFAPVAAAVAVAIAAVALRLHS